MTYVLFYLSHAQYVKKKEINYLENQKFYPSVVLYQNCIVFYSQIIYSLRKEAFSKPATRNLLQRVKDNYEGFINGKLSREITSGNSDSKFKTSVVGRFNPPRLPHYVLINAFSRARTRSASVRCTARPNQKKTDWPRSVWVYSLAMR